LAEGEKYNKNKDLGALSSLFSHIIQCGIFWWRIKGSW